MDLNAQLLQMIDSVSHAEDVRTAAVCLLHPLLRHLEMEQAVFCEEDRGHLQPIFAMDWTRQILKKEDLWLSHTLIAEALDSMEPATHVDSENLARDLIPQSVHRHDLRYVVVLPVSKSPRQVVHLASRRLPDQQLGPEALDHLRTATKAAVLALQQQRNFSQLREQNKGLIAKLKTHDRRFLYASHAMEKVVEEMKRVAPFNISILLQGESGTGKEEIAKFIHEVSGRRGRFIAVNCANLTESLLESELFGHAKGAFTGAIQQKNGLLLEAEEGTFFLDEIGELPFGLQAKLLRVLQERSVRPLGGNKDIPLNVRFLAASHKNLATLVKEQKFREDLYYRIQELAVEIPPLRQRPEDISLLANYFVHDFSREFQLPDRKILPDAIAHLLQHNWPGNVRELKNVCRMAVVLSRTEGLTADDFRLNSLAKKAESTEPASEAEELNKVNALAPTSLPAIDAINILDQLNLNGEVCLRSLMEDLERKIIHSLLKKQGATQATVAKRLGISIRTLQRSLQ